MTIQIENREVSKGNVPGHKIMRGLADLADNIHCDLFRVEYLPAVIPRN